MRRSFLAPLLVVSIALAAGCEGAGGDSGDSPAFAAPDGGFDAASPSDGGVVDVANDSGDPGLSARAIELAKMQAHLDSLYSPSDVVHRFTTSFGDAVDCLPFAKQPGFSLLGSVNGTPPTLTTPRALAQAAAVAGFGEGSDADGNLRECPSGAVPIRQVTLTDLARFATLADALAKEPLQVLDQVDASGNNHEHATYSTMIANWGAEATFDVWNPAVEPDDFSLSQTWIIGGTGDGAQTVEAGYIAYPARYGNSTSRLFIYSTTDDYNRFNTSNCWDLGCKAFVQLADSHILIGGKFDIYSQPSGEQREFKLRWQLCPISQCGDWAGWWLRYDGGATSEWVGFYPRARYATSGILDSAQRIDFGGEVSFVQGVHHTTTDMGSGQAASGGFGVAAYQTDLLRITTDNAWAAMGPMMNTDQAPGCYASGPLTTSSNPELLDAYAKETFYFGGTGYGAGCP